MTDILHTYIYTLKPTKKNTNNYDRYFAYIYLYFKPNYKKTRITMTDILHTYIYTLKPTKKNTNNYNRYFAYIYLYFKTNKKKTQIHFNFHFIDIL